LAKPTVRGPNSLPPGISSIAGQAADDKVEKHACKGLNSCKGKGGCKSSDNGCKGKNSCKGKGGCATDGSKKNVTAVWVETCSLGRVQQPCPFSHPSAPV
jgi:hypothetical protein